MLKISHNENIDSNEIAKNVAGITLADSLNTDVVGKRFQAICKSSNSLHLIYCTLMKNQIVKLSINGGRLLPVIPSCELTKW